MINYWLCRNMTKVICDENEGNEVPASGAGAGAGADAAVGSEPEAGAGVDAPEAARVYARNSALGLLAETQRDNIKR